jgi:hypothetical protein
MLSQGPTLCDIVAIQLGAAAQGAENLAVAKAELIANPPGNRTRPGMRARLESDPIQQMRTFRRQEMRSAKPIRAANPGSSCNVGSSSRGPTLPSAARYSQLFPHRTRVLVDQEKGNANRPLADRYVPHTKNTAAHGPGENNKANSLVGGFRSTFNDVSDFCRQGRRGKGFLQKRHFGCQRAF